MLLAVKLAGLFMNAAIREPSTTSAGSSCLPVLLIHIGRTVWLLTAGLYQVNQEHFVRVLIWFLAAAPLWLTGAAASGGQRLTWWAATTLIELAGTWAAHPAGRTGVIGLMVSVAGMIAAVRTPRLRQ